MSFSWKYLLIGVNIIKIIWVDLIWFILFISRKYNVKYKYSRYYIFDYLCVM